MASTHLALLRGINAGGKNKLSMKELIVLFREAGCEDVQSYIQSGNILFRAQPGVAEALGSRISEEIAKRFGLRIPVVLRTAEQLDETVRRNPFPATEAIASNLHVMFLRDVPMVERVRELDENRSPLDKFAVRERDVYLQLLTGAARSKLTNQYFDSKLKTISTVRNWQTVTKLQLLMQS